MSFVKGSDLPLLPQDISTRKDIGSVLITVGEVLKKVFREIWPGENYFWFRARIDRDINIRNIGRCEIARYWTVGKAAEEADTLKVGFFFASLYHRSALKMLEQSDMERASTLLTHAARQLGVIEGYLYFVDHIGVGFKGPLKGGQANQYVRYEVGEYLVVLLDRFFDGGWKSQEKIADNLKDELEVFIISKGYGKIVPSAENFIKAALKRKGRPREAYLSKKMAKGK